MENIMIVGKAYRLKGTILNGTFVNNDGNVEINYSDEDVVRCIKRITDDRVYAECGRVFLREGLQVEKVSYETYEE
jgi:hypothetical protein